MDPAGRAYTRTGRGGRRWVRAIRHTRFDDLLERPFFCNAAPRQRLTNVLVMFFNRTTVGWQLQKAGHHEWNCAFAYCGNYFCHRRNCFCFAVCAVAFYGWGAHLCVAAGRRNWRYGGRHLVLSGIEYRSLSHDRSIRSLAFCFADCHCCFCSPGITGLSAVCCCCRRFIRLLPVGFGVLQGCAPNFPPQGGQYETESDERRKFYEQLGEKSE